MDVGTTNIDVSLVEALLAFRNTPIPSNFVALPDEEEQPCAKLIFDNWSYSVHKTCTIIGRASSDDGTDVMLSDSKQISRRHATLQFDAHNNTWSIICHGRNGVVIDGAFYAPSDIPIPLNSRCQIKIVDVNLFFMSLPSDALDLDSDCTVTENESITKDFEKPSKKVTLSKPRPRKPHLGNNNTVKSNKPDLSYASLIASAILQAPQEKITLGGIYEYIKNKYTYFKETNPSGWQKVPRNQKDPGKGMYWTINPEYRHAFDEQGKRKRIGKKKNKNSLDRSSSAEDFIVVPDATTLLQTFPSNYYTLKNIDDAPKGAVGSLVCHDGSPSLDTLQIQSHTKVNIKRYGEIAREKVAKMNANEAIHQLKNPFTPNNMKATFQNQANKVQSAFNNGRAQILKPLEGWSPSNIKATVQNGKATFNNGKAQIFSKKYPFKGSTKTNNNMHTEPEHDAYHDQFTESQGKVKKASGFYKYVGKPVMKVAKPMVDIAEGFFLAA
ncbi:hypothetical protein ROZALSC1DRAFT_30094 [Rozella allomycis CSF55]|uniref:Forkhead-associated (FHA) domain-containing protein n=1 Tax=Rozella allomycis (strain CSF55) TaxID=988480 RepID=A0A4V1IZI6_ROZAC|nr:hypothetical protein ROZALSC1DRAFT_30094 [Rozella allomycis CSF55]